MKFEVFFESKIVLLSYFIYKNWISIRRGGVCIDWEEENDLGMVFVIIMNFLWVVDYVL